MRRSKKATITILTLSAFVMLGQFTPAQTTQNTQQGSGAGTGTAGGGGMGRGGGQGGQQIARMLEELNLTDEQKSKSKTILADQAKQMKTVREDTALEQEARQAKMREIRQATMKQITAMLTPEQQKKMDELRQKARENSQPSTSTESQQKSP